MAASDWQIELVCAVCHHAEAVSAAGTAKRLLAAGLLRSHSQATPDELRELVLALAGKLPCPICGQVGLSAKLLEDETHGWLEARRCEDCGKPIDPERLEIFPDAKLCPACQGREEAGHTPGTGEYCRACGSLMVVRPSTGRGIHRYVLTCSACGGKSG